MLSLMVLLLLLLWSVWVVLQHVLPKQMTALRLKLARHSAATWPRLASVLQPKTQSGCAGGCHCPAANNNATNHKTDSSPMSHNKHYNNPKDSNDQHNTVAVADAAAANHVIHAKKIAAVEQPIRWRNSV